MSEVGVVQTVSGEDATSVKPGDVIVRIDPRYFRPTEVETLLGDPSNAKAKLGWEPVISLEEMVAEMVSFDLEEARRRVVLAKHGFNTIASRGE